MPASRLVAALLLLLLGSGCAFLDLSGERLPLHREVAPLPAETGCQIAVLPFLNDSDYPLGGLFMQKVFAAQLLSAGSYQLAPEGDIVKVYRQLRLLPGQEPTLEQLRIMADRLEAPLLLSGIVLNMEEGRGEHQTINPQLVLEVELRDPATGEIVWKTFHRRSGTDYKQTMHFGIVHSMTGLGAIMADEIINLWQEKGLPPCKN
jgi:hypothetical protein